MEFGLKWVHMARYELILRLDGALWLPIISGPLLTQKWSNCDSRIPARFANCERYDDDLLVQKCRWCIYWE